MSKKKYKKQKQKNFPWLLIALGGILLIIMAFVFVNRNPGGTPILTADKETIDYGDVKLDTPLTFSVVVTNTGDGVLKFKEQPYLEVLEGC